MSSFRLSALSASVCLSLSPLSVSAEQADEQNANQLEPITVTTATRVPLMVGETLSSVTVIDREMIEQQQPREFTDLLLGQPGVDVTGNGAYGKNTSIFTRGTASDGTVLLIDGIRLRSATSGGAPWQFLAPQLIDRVEIVRGPRSSLYGADAVGGVVQAFTLQPDGGDRGWLELGGGSFDSGQAGAGFASQKGSTRYNFAINHFQTDGTAVIEAGDDKGYDNTSAIASVSHGFANGAELALLGLHARGNTEFEGGDTDFVIQTAGARLDLPVTDLWLARLQLSEARDKAFTVDTWGESTFNTLSQTARWENLIQAGDHQVIVGAEAVDDKVNSSTDYDEDSRYNYGYFAQLLMGFGPVDLQLSGRHDDNQAYGSHNTGAVAAGLSLDQQHRLRASYATAFKAPTFNELYFPGFGNSDLTPEESETVEVGVGGHYSRWFWDLATYQTDITDMIVFDMQTSAPANVAKARVRGVELESGLRLDSWTLRGAMAWTDPRDRDTDNRLPRRSGKSLRVDLDKALGDLSLGGSVIAQGHRFNDAANDNRLSGFATLNLRAGWQFNEAWSTRLTVNNVLDKEYSTTQRFDGTNFLAAGRNLFLTLRYDIR